MNCRKFSAVLLLSLAAPFLGAADVDDLQSISTKETVLPIFNRDKLQFILFGGEVTPRAGLVHVKEPVLDIVRSNVDLDRVKTGPARAYRLHAPLREVFDFWKDRVIFSDGTAISAQAEVDQPQKLASGSGPVFFRSPALDVNGVGFQADLKAKVITVGSEVRIVGRTGESDVRKIIASGRFPAAVDEVAASADTMRIDLAGRQIDLTGNVMIDQEDYLIFCDEMSIYLSRDQQSEEGGAAVGNPPVALGESSGEISRIIYRGNVRIEPKKNAAEERQSGAQAVPAAAADVRPGFAEGTLFLPCAAPAGTQSGVPAKPTRLSSDQSEFDFRSNILTFTGRVEVRDPRLNLDCEKMQIFLKEVDADGKTIPPPRKGEKKRSGKKVVDRVVCTGKVSAEENRARLNTEKMTLYFARRPAGKKPEKAPGLFNSAGSELERIVCDSSLRLASRPENDPKYRPGTPLPPPSVLTADRGELLLFENLAHFDGNVHVVDSDFILDSNHMTLRAEDSPAAAPARPVPADPLAITVEPLAPPLIRISDNLELREVTATGAVRAERRLAGVAAQRAFGEKAFYDVPAQLVTLSGDSRNPARVLAEDGNFTNPGGSLELNLKNGVVRTVGGRGTAEMTAPGQF